MKKAEWDSERGELIIRDMTDEEIADHQAPMQAEPVPATVTMRQARLALLSIGVLGNVDTAIDSLPSPEKEKARIEWDYSSTVDRNRPFVVTLGHALKLDDAALDQLFIEAAKL